MPKKRARARGRALRTPPRQRSAPGRLPPEALGLVGENRVVELAIALTGGRVVPFRPLVDIDGNDLLFKRRRGRPILRAQVKVRAVTTRLGAVEVAVEDAELPADDPKLVVVMLYVADRAQPEGPVWVIPSDVFLRGAHHSHGMWKANLSTKAGSADRWVAYRHRPADIGAVLEAHLDAVGAGGAFATPAKLRAAVRGASRGRRHRGGPGWG